MKPEAQIRETYLSIPDLAARWKKSNWWVYTNHQKLDVPRLKLGREWRFPLVALEQWERDRL